MAVKPFLLFTSSFMHKYGSTAIPRGTFCTHIQLQYVQVNTCCITYSCSTWSFSEGSASVCLPNDYNMGFTSCETHVDCGYGIMDKGWGYCAGGNCAVLIE